MSFLHGKGKIMYKIAISGKANTGKNTISKIIADELREKKRKWYRKRGYVPPAQQVKYMAFADPIKKLIEVMFPQTPKNWLYGPSKCRNGIIPGALKDGKPLTVRQLLLDLGTGVGRGYKDSIWLDNFEYRFNKNKKSDIVVVTDVRFRKEFEYLKNKGFYQIRLYRETGQPDIKHTSETDQKSIADKEFDYLLINNKPLVDLKKEVRDNIIPFLL